MNRLRIVLLSLWCAGCLCGQETAPAAAPGSKGLDTQVASIDFRDVVLRDALRLLTEESGVNLVASAEAGQRPITCYLVDVTLRQAIETIAKTYGLWFKVEDPANVVRVMTAKEFERDLVLFRDEKTRVFTMYFPNAVDVAVAIRNLFGARVRLSLDRDILADAYTEILQRFQRFDVINRRSQGLGTLGGQGQVQNGQQGGFNGVNSLNGFNSQNTFNQNNAQGGLGNQQGFDQNSVRGDLLDNRGAQVEGRLTPAQIEQLADPGNGVDAAEGEALRQARGEVASIFVTIQRRSNIVAVRTADSAAMQQIEALVKQLDVPTPQVLLEIRVLLLDMGDDFRSMFDASYDAAGYSGSFQDTEGVDPSALIFRYVSDHFTARLQALQQKNRVTSLATPLLLVANNEVSRLFVGEERPIVRNISSQTTVNQATTTVTPNNTVELRPVGTTLLITPSINADRTVTLRVLNELSSVREGGGKIPVVTSDGNVINQPVDTVSARSVSGTLVAHDGMTLALGGLVQEGIEVTEQGVPGLMDLPLLGFFFRREVKVRNHSELIVLIRPYVLFTPAEGNDISKRVVERISIHAAAGGDGEPMRVFGKDEAPRPDLAADPLKELLQFQSGLPGGR